jgi:predicted DNA-binding transcriptional regulator AlpA
MKTEYTPREDRVLSEKEAARYLNLARQTLSNLRFKKEGPPYIRLLPGRIGYKLSDLEAYLAARRIDPEAIGKTA